MRLFAGTQWDVPPSCERCEQELEKCQCEPLPEPIPEPIPPGQQKLVIRREKRKKGKIVTVVRGFRFQSSNEGQQLLKQLKESCGTGGIVEDDKLELQGDLQKRLETLLSQLGYRVRIG